LPLINKVKYIFMLGLIISMSVYAQANFKTYSIDSNSQTISFEFTKNRKLSLEKNMVPRGSAVLTTSGQLKKDGIKGIIHAATGSMNSSDTNFSPNLEGIKNSIKNSLIIAKKNKISSLAFPFLGSGIFLTSIGVSRNILAREILDTIIKNHENPSSLMIKLVAYSKEDLGIFKKEFEVLTKENPELVKRIEILEGSITDYSLHKSEVIVNAANTELVFGGGISGHIGSKTKEANSINLQCRKLIDKLKSETK